MFGSLVGSGIAACLIYSSMKWQPKEVQKIQFVFRNIGYSKDRMPKFKNRNKTDNYTDYIFIVPSKLIDNNLQSMLEQTLIKPVAVIFRGVLIIRIYSSNLPTKVNYEKEDVKDWIAPIGISRDGKVYHDFDKLQHMTIAGTSQWGKTSFIKMLVTSLIENHPDDVEFYVLDLKGMLSFNRYANLKQVKAVAGNYKESANVLKVVENDIKKTMYYFKSKYIENINETNIKTRKFIIIDEAGELVPKPSMTDDEKHDVKECQRIISYIVRISAALGYRMLYGTQYPTAKIMDNQIKANASARISFRLQTSVQSNVAIDEAGAEELSCPGRGIYKTIESHEIQTPYISSAEMWGRLKKYDISKCETEQVRNDTIEFG